MRTRTTLAATALLLAACTPRSAPPVSAGKRIFEGPVALLAASPDGARLAWLSGCTAGAPGKSAPGCTLLVAPAGGGAPVRVAEGVAPVAGSIAWTRDGALLALARRDAVTGAGDLVLWRPGAEPRLLAPGASAFAAGPGGEVAVAAGGEVFLSTNTGERQPLRGGAGAFELAFAPLPERALAARARGTGGAPVLLLWRGMGGDPALVARDVGSFGFSPDGAWLAAVAGVVPGTEGVLVAVPVARGTGAVSDPVLLARAVGPFRWAAGAPRLAWLEGFDARVHAGRLASAQPGQAPVVLGDRVTSFELSPGGGQLAFVRHVTEGGYSANLEVSATAAASPVLLARDAAGFDFSPDGRFVYWRAGCAPSGDGCALFRAPAGGFGASTPPERLADGVASFALSPGPGDRALVSLLRKDASVDVAAWAGGRLVPLDVKALSGSAILLPPDGKRAAWIGTAPDRPGVFVADLP
jgi:hypothetical protein